MLEAAPKYVFYLPLYILMLTCLKMALLQVETCSISVKAI